MIATRRMTKADTTEIHNIIDTDSRFSNLGLDQKAELSIVVTNAIFAIKIKNRSIDVASKAKELACQYASKLNL